MAFLAKLSTLFLLLISLILSSHARESQFFSKVTSTTNPSNKKVVANNEEFSKYKQEEQPTFFLDEDNRHGLYDQHPTTTTTPTTTYLPWNYDKHSYVTGPEPKKKSQKEDINSRYQTATENIDNTNNHFYNKETPVTEKYENPTWFDEDTASNPNYDSSYNTKYYDNDERNGYDNYNTQQEETKYRDNKYERSFNRVQPQEQREAATFKKPKTTTHGKPQGMSDTRLQDEKYFYNVEKHDFSETHPYKTFNNNYYENKENGFTGSRFYRNQQEFQEEEDTP